MSAVQEHERHRGYEAEEHVSGLPLNIRSNGLAASQVVKPGPGGLYGFTVMNTSAAAQYVQVFDAATLPADGIVPDVVFVVQGNDFLAVEYLPPRRFKYGCVLCNSSTVATKTIGSANCFFDVQFV